MIAIVSPTHKKELSTLEFRRLRITIQNNSRFEHYFLVPDNLETSQLRKQFPRSQYIKFPSFYFQSVMTYCNLMLKAELYETFISLGYKSILIAQTDSFVIRNIQPLAQTSYDYIGASWNPPWRIHDGYIRYFVNRGFPFNKLPTETIASGNGGLSWRRTEAMKEITEWFQDYFIRRKFYKGGRLIMNEDLIIAFGCRKLGFNVPDSNEANSIFVESIPVHSIDRGIVYGYHGLNKYQFNMEEILILDAEKSLGISLYENS